jgi:hypothetical protein
MAGAPRSSKCSRTVAEAWFRRPSRMMHVCMCATVARVLGDFFLFVVVGYCW